MLLTEEQAREKWCPMVHGAVDDAVAAINRQNKDNEPLGNCIASDCMMWRRAVNERGFCGLADKPAWRP